MHGETVKLSRWVLKRAEFRAHDDLFCDSSTLLITLFQNSREFNWQSFPCRVWVDSAETLTSLHRYSYSVLCRLCL